MRRADDLDPFDPFDRLVVSCEHAVCRVPPPLASRFRGAGRVLRSHRGLDRGALALARLLARRFDAPLHAATVSRLVVDANRSVHHRDLFSRWTRSLPPAERAALVDRYHRPYREAVEQSVGRAVAEGAVVLHLSVHSFTPRLRGEVRRADLALLYDPARARERSLCARWRGLLLEREPGLRIRRNHPYRGTADGLTTALRRRFAARHYLGVELEISQRWVSPAGAPDRALARAVVETLEALRSPTR